MGGPDIRSKSRAIAPRDKNLRRALVLPGEALEPLGEVLSASGGDTGHNPRGWAAKLPRFDLRFPSRVVVVGKSGGRPHLATDAVPPFHAGVTHIDHDIGLHDAASTGLASR